MRELRIQLHTTESIVQTLRDEADVLKQQLEDARAENALAATTGINFEEELANAERANRSLTLEEQRAVILELNQKVLGEEKHLPNFSHAPFPNSVSW